MNRREMLLSSAGLLVPHPGFMDEVTAAENWLSVIDERLSGKIHPLDMRDNEFGFLSAEVLMTSKVDEILYYSLSRQQCCSLLYNTDRLDTYHKMPIWIAKRNGAFYIKVDAETLATRRSFLEEVKNDKEKDPWLMRPAMLAYYQCYPLGGSPLATATEYQVYFVPSEWAECAKHPMVQRNIDALRNAVGMMDQLKEIHGINSGIQGWDHDQKQLKEALLKG